MDGVRGGGNLVPRVIPSWERGSGGGGSDETDYEFLR